MPAGAEFMESHARGPYQVQAGPECDRSIILFAETTPLLESGGQRPAHALVAVVVLVSGPALTRERIDQEASALRP
jgi:hypothetical protein